MGITIDISKAKEVWKNKIRFKRGKALKKLDLDFMKAQEAGTSITSITADKKTLRDLPAQVDSATTVDEIKAVWDTDKLGDK